MLGSVSGDSKRPQSAIGYTIGPDDSRNDDLNTRARFGWLAALALLMVVGVGGRLWNQQEPAPSLPFQCEEVRAFARDAELRAVSTLARRNLLLTELDELPRSLTPLNMDRRNELRREIPVQESRALVGYSGWEDAINLNRECFVRANLVFAESRIQMVRVLFE